MEKDMNLSQRKSKRPDASFSQMAKAWAALNRETQIGVIRSDREYRKMSALVDKLIDEIGSDEKHELASLLSVLGSLIAQYEEDNVHIDDASPADVLRLLMTEHGLKQADLAAEIGSQGIVSEILNGKRQLNARQAKALGARFNVSPAVFL
jgi:HTH-type transcriptional regulator / antitoxin HigA